MAETEEGSAPTEMKVSSLPPSPYAKDAISPLTPSTVSTDMSSPKDIKADEMASSEEPANKEISEGANVKAFDDDSLPSDEAEEDVKNASFETENETAKEELPFDEAPTKEETVEETASTQEETTEESTRIESPKGTDDQVVEKQEEPSDESAPSALKPDPIEEDTQDSTEKNEEAVAAQEDTEEKNVEDESPEDDVKESTEVSTEKVGAISDASQNEEPAKEPEGTLEETVEDNAEATVETPENEVAAENNEEETLPQSEEPVEESEPETLQQDDKIKAEDSGEEVQNVEEPSQNDAPESDAETRRPSPVQVQFDVPIDDDNNKETPSSTAMITPRSGGTSFLAAFSTSPISASMSPPIVSPRSTSNASASSTRSNNSFSSYQESASDTPTSHSALSASKNKRASGLISKYQEKVAHEALPGDSVPIRSSSYKGYKFANVSPGTARILQQKAEKSFVELNSLPDMNSVRAKFEKSSRKSGGKFEFGETFRQKQRHEQLSEKEKEQEAKVNIRGFNEKILNGGKTATAEIDTSNLPKSFTFDMSTSAPLFPNDGVCRVDYINADFRSKVFVVHKTRGMLLLQDKEYSITTSKTSGKKKKRRKSTIPGGKIKEEEFLTAAQESGSPQVQLQIAAREAAARLVFETTGLDIRMQADRLKPAVLCMTPSMNAARGYEYLRNENEERLYYFLQVEEEDFEKLEESQGDEAPKLTRPSEDPGEDPAPAKLKRPSADPGDEPLPLKISSDYSGFEFVQDPGKASKVLKKDGNDAAIALSMIMSAAAQEINGTSPTAETAVKEPDAKATEFENKSMLDDELDDDDENPPVDGTIRTVGVKEDEESKPEGDPEEKSTEDDDKESKEAEAGEAEGGANKSKEADAQEEAKIIDEKTLYHDDIKIHLKTSSESMEDPVGVSCCCTFW